MKIEWPYDYVSQWCLTDFYSDYDKLLRGAIESGTDFDTGWIGCKKEIRSMRIRRLEDGICVDVSESMDDLWEADDLIYDALWEVAHSEKELPDEILDSIRDAAIEDGVDDHAEDYGWLPRNADYDTIVEKINEMEKHVSNQTSYMFEKLKDIVKAHLEYMKTEV